MTTSPASSANDDLDELVATNLAHLDERLARAGTSRARVRVVAVTKTLPATYVRAAARAGLVCVGENYAQELVAKREACDAPVRWFYLGALQSNKIPALARAADLLASVARVRELEVLARQPVVPPVYLEVDFTGAATRNGAPPGAIEGLLARSRDLGIDVRGLMTVAPPEPDAAARAFADLAAAADEYHLVERSMGMSDDLELALAHGSTEIRVGRALFGPRRGR